MARCLVAVRVHTPGDYPLWPFFEDLKFESECDREEGINGRWVLRCNRFLYHKLFRNDWLDEFVAQVPLVLVEDGRCGQITRDTSYFVCICTQPTDIYAHCTRFWGGVYVEFQPREKCSAA